MRSAVDDERLVDADGEQATHERGDRGRLVETGNDCADDGLMLAGLHDSKTPAQAAVAAGLGRLIGLQRLAEGLVARPVPDLRESFLRRVAQRVVLVAALRKGRDAAWERAAVCRHVHDRPGPAAQGPGVPARSPFEAEAGFARRARRRERNSEFAREVLCCAKAAQLLASHPFEQGLIGPGQPDRVLVEEDEPLQVDLLDTDVRGNAHEIRQFGDGLLEASQPQRHARFCYDFALLHRPEPAHVGEDALEIVLAPHGFESFARCRVQRDAQLVESGLDQRAPVALVEDRAVSVEEHIDVPLRQIADHLRQRLHQHRLANPVQHCALEVRKLIDDRTKPFPIHVRRRLEIGVCARAGRAQQIAPIGHFQIQADRRPRRDPRAVRVGRFMVAPRVDRLRCGDCAPGCLRYGVAPLTTRSFTSCVGGEFANS